MCEGSSLRDAFLDLVAAYHRRVATSPESLHSGLQLKLKSVNGTGKHIMGGSYVYVLSLKIKTKPKKSKVQIISVWPMKDWFGLFICCCMFSILQFNI